jgi:Tol biopolymer transport system component
MSESPIRGEAIIAAIVTVVGGFLVTVILSYLEGRIGFEAIVVVMAIVMLIAVGIWLISRRGLRQATGILSAMVIVGAAFFLAFAVIREVMSKAPAGQGLPTIPTIISKIDQLAFGQTTPMAFTATPGALPQSTGQTSPTARPGQTGTPQIPPSPTSTAAVAAPTYTAVSARTPAPTGVPLITSFRGRIVYTHFRGPNRYGDFDVMLMDIPGDGPRKIADRGSEPAFSPDGRRIIYYSWNDNGFFSMAPDGGDRRRISSSTEDSYPAWSPDGTRIAFSLFENRYNIWIMNADGSGRTKIIDGGEQPSWSPDGSRIVYKGCMGANCGLMVADSNGGNKRLISRNANDSSPSWSPGGGYILFTSDRSGNLDVWMMRADGSDPRPLTTNPTSDGAATWSPDGNFIFFRSDRDGSWGIYMMDHEGGQQRKVVSANVSERWWWERVSVSR